MLYNPGRAANLVGQHLLVEDLFLCCAPSATRRARGRRCRWPTRSHAPLILPGRPHGLRILVDSALRRSGSGDQMSCSNSIPWRRSRCWSADGDAATILPFCGVYREVASRDDCRAPDRLALADAHSGRRRDRASAQDAGDDGGGACLREEVERLVAAGLWTGPD